MCNCDSCQLKRKEKLYRVPIDEPLDHVAETSNPGVIGRVVGNFRSRRTGQLVTVIAKKGESSDSANSRVRARHS